MYRYSTRPIPIPKSQLREIAKRAVALLPKLLRRFEKDRSIAEQRGTLLSDIGRLDLLDVRQNRVTVPVVLSARHRDLSFGNRRYLVSGGRVFSVGFADGTTAKVRLMVELDSAKTPNQLLKQPERLQKEIYSVLIHETTHLRDIYKPNSKTDYYNRPHEMRAFMQQITEEVLEYIHHLGESGALWAGPSKHNIKSGVEKSLTWMGIKQSLNPRSRNTILKGVYTGVMDEMPRLKKLYPPEDW